MPRYENGIDFGAEQMSCVVYGSIENNTHFPFGRKTLLHAPKIKSALSGMSQVIFLSVHPFKSWVLFSITPYGGSVSTISTLQSGMSFNSSKQSPCIKFILLHLFFFGATARLMRRGEAYIPGSRRPTAGYRKEKEIGSTGYAPMLPLSHKFRLWFLKKEELSNSSMRR